MSQRASRRGYRCRSWLAAKLSACRSRARPRRGPHYRGDAGPAGDGLCAPRRSSADSRALRVRCAAAALRRAGDLATPRGRSCRHGLDPRCRRGWRHRHDRHRELHPRGGRPRDDGRRDSSRARLSARRVPRELLVAAGRGRVHRSCRAHHRRESARASSRRRASPHPPRAPGRLGGDSKRFGLVLADACRSVRSRSRRWS